MDLRNIDLRATAQRKTQATTFELSDEQLSSVSGGKGKASVGLMNACATGQHILSATIICR